MKTTRPQNTTKAELTEHLIESKKQKIVSTLIERTGKQPAKILAEDVLYHLPEDVIFEDYDVISQDYLDMTFYSYLYRKISLEGQSHEKYALGKAPWAVLNEVIRTAGLPYSFTSPDEEPIRAIFRNPLNRNSTYKFKIKLINAEGIEIGIQNVSSGERVILSLAMLLYYFQHRNVRKKLLILDEIDAHLHPSLTKQFFEVVNQNVIRDYQANVIMATHSPSTVALAPEDSLFIIEKGQSETAIKRSTKDSALNLLTAGVPSLSVNYENRRQIFVESKYDAEYYDYVYRAIRPKLPEGVSLNFISSGVSGSGNCDQVIKIVSQLNDFGNKSIFGIIDWDLKNRSSRNIQVLGEGKRYSIENYIFDPVLMGYFLWREKILNSGDFGFPIETSILDFKILNVSDIQRICDVVISKVKNRFKASENPSLSIVKYANGMEVSVPNWYTTNYGHQLPDIYLSEFASLRKYHQENAFRNAVILNTITDIPWFIPDDLIQLMRYFHDLEVH